MFMPFPAKSYQAEVASLQSSEVHDQALSEEQSTIGLFQIGLTTVFQQALVHLPLLCSIWVLKEHKGRQLQYSRRMKPQKCGQHHLVEPYLSKYQNSAFP